MTKSQAFAWLKHLEGSVRHLHPAITLPDSMAWRLLKKAKSAPARLIEDMAFEVKAAVIEALLANPQATEAELVAVVDTVATTFRRVENAHNNGRRKRVKLTEPKVRPDGTVRLTKETTVWYGVTRLDHEHFEAFSLQDDPARTVERDQAEAASASAMGQLLKGWRWEELLALELLSSPHAGTRSVRNIREQTKGLLSRRGLDRLKAWRKRMLAERAPKPTGLEFYDYGEDAPVVVDRPATPPRGGSDMAV